MRKLLLSMLSAALSLSAYSESGTIEFDVTGNTGPAGWPTTSNNAPKTATTYSLTDADGISYDFQVEQVFWHKSTTNGAFCFVKAQAGSFTLPSLAGKAITRVDFFLANNSNISNGVALEVLINDNNVGNIIMTKNEVITFDVPDTYQISNNVIKLHKVVTDKTCGVSKMTIYWTDAEGGGDVTLPPSKPTIEMVEGGEGYVVTMSCSTEGATIHYTDDGSEPTAESTIYSAPIACWAETTYKAVAEKDGLLSPVATFIANPPYFLDGFSNLYDFMEIMEPNQKVPVIILGEMTAIYQNGQYLYVKAGDGFMSSYMLVYGNTGKTLANGDTFNRLEGQFTVYNGMPEIASPAIVGEITTGTAVEPEPIYDLTEVAQYNLYHYVTIENVNLNLGSGKNVTLTDADNNTCAAYNQFNIALEDCQGCTVTGIVSKYGDNIQLYIIDVTGGVETLHAPVFTPESGSTLAMYDEVTITTEEGASIYYRIVDVVEDFELYEEPYFVMSTGTLTIEAYATKDGINSETVTATYTVSKPSPGLAWINAEGEPVTEVIYVIDGTEEQQWLPEPTGMMMGDPMLTSSNPEVAAVNEYMGLDILAVGEATITISIEETSMYAAESASFVLKVITAEEANKIMPVVDFTSNTNNQKSFENGKVVTWESTGGQFLFEAIATLGENSNGNSNYPAFVNSSKALALYGSSDNIITVSAPAGYMFKAVEFNFDPNGQSWLPTVNGAACIASSTSNSEVICGTTLPAASSQITIGCGATSKSIRIRNIAFELAAAPSAVNSIEAENADKSIEYFNLQGVRIENPTSGLYISRQGNKVTKVVIR